MRVSPVPAPGLSCTLTLPVAGLCRGSLLSGRPAGGEELVVLRVCPAEVMALESAAPWLVFVFTVHAASVLPWACDPLPCCASSLSRPSRVPPCVHGSQRSWYRNLNQPGKSGLVLLPLREGASTRTWQQTSFRRALPLADTRDPTHGSGPDFPRAQTAGIPSGNAWRGCFSERRGTTEQEAVGARREMSSWLSLWNTVGCDERRS